MKVLLATDGSDNALRASDYVLKLANEGLNIQITVLTVISLNEEIARVDGLDREEYSKLVEMRASSVFKKHRDKFERYKNLQVQYVVRRGDVSEEIVSLSEEGQFDQIVIGSRGLSNIKELFLGSVSHKVIHISKCPVTIVK